MIIAVPSTAAPSIAASSIAVSSIALPSMALPSIALSSIALPSKRLSLLLVLGTPVLVRRWYSWVVAGLRRAKTTKRPKTHVFGGAFVATSRRPHQPAGGGRKASPSQYTGVYGTQYTGSGSNCENWMLIMVRTGSPASTRPIERSVRRCNIIITSPATSDRFRANICF